MLPQVGEDPQLHVGEWAYGEGDPRGGQAVHQGVVLLAGHPVVDALRPEQVEGVADVTRGALLAGVGDRPQAGSPGPGEGRDELLRRVPPLTRIEAYGDDVAQERASLLQGLQGALLRQMAQEAHDELRGQPQPLAGVGARPGEAPHEDGEADAAPGVGLRVEEHLGVADVVGRGALQVGPHEVVEVLLRLQDGRSLVVDVQERLEVGELVRAPYLLDRGEGQRQPVALGQAEHHLRLQRALDVQVQFHLGQAPDELLHGFPSDDLRRA